MEKKIVIFIGIIAELFLVGLILAYLAARIWLFSRFDSVVKDLNYDEFVQEIRSTPSLPDKVFDAYSKVYFYDERTTTNQFLMIVPLGLLSNKHQNARCPCVDANYPFVYNTFDRWTVGLHLDNDVGGKKCIEYNLNKFDFLLNQIGIRNASIFYFDKELEALTDREMITLCIMTKNPHFFNPKLNPERLQKELKRYAEL